MSALSFSKHSLSAAQLSNLESLGYYSMTPIQAAALPVALAGKDLIAQARTGSGKTAVFALALLARLDLTSRATQALVLCPTRELSIQVSSELRRLARHLPNVMVTTLYGGQPIDLQKRALKKGAQIVVGTLGRVVDHIKRDSLKLQDLSLLVLDEADRILEMGFMNELEKIIRDLPADRQTLLFSATFPDNIENLSRHVQRNPTHVSVDEQQASDEIEQVVYHCKAPDKLDGLKKILLEYQPVSAVVFCNYKQSTFDICDFLSEQGFSAAALNGDLEQRDREDLLIQFKHQSCSVLIATDVAARGLDIKDLPLVINYELPSDPETYVHRIGRTGRAGKSGIAVSLCSEREKFKLSEINAYQNSAFELESLSILRSRLAKIPDPTFVTICISGGRDAKVRAGEILGALTGAGGLEGSQVGKIDIMDYKSYVAVQCVVADRAVQQLSRSKIKGRRFKIKKL